jgi:hypothetical protein
MADPGIVTEKKPARRKMIHQFLERPVEQDIERRLHLRVGADV